MKILVTGANGQVGREFPECAKNVDSKCEIISASRKQLDITRLDKVKSYLAEVQPAIIVNAAAYTAVDRAEEEKELAFLINRDGAANLARVCAGLEIPLIQISTDYVFDGSRTEAYVETDSVNPMSIYGQSKLEGEQQIQQLCEKHIILRTSWVFGVYGRNFVYTMVRLAGQRPELRVVNDQFGCPTSAYSIARAILKICEKIGTDNDVNWGVYHYCGTPATNWYEFSREIIETARQQQDLIVKDIQPVATSEYPTAAVRPKNSVLDCDKIRHHFGIEQQPWLEGLKDMMRHPHFFKTLTLK